MTVGEAMDYKSVPECSEHVSNEGGLKEGLTMIVPVFNEEEGIRTVLVDINKVLEELGIPNEIIVVDDGSSDKTPEELSKLDFIKIIRNPVNVGYGAAIKKGIQESLHEWIGITDGDGTYPSEAIPVLLSESQKADMVVGARLGKKARIPLMRRPAKWFLNQVANYLAQRKIPDLNSGLRIFKKNAAMRFINIISDRFSFTTTITLAMLCNGYEVKYIPIEYHTRKGKSKIHPIQDTINFLQLIIRTILYFDPLRIFLPIGTCLVLTSTVLFVLRLLHVGRFGVTIPMFLLAGIQILAIGMLADLIEKRMKS
jgi:glycosyltransferase involved in cell wall biosynthesis